MRWSARVPIVVDCCRMKPFASCSRLSVPHFPGNREGVGRTIVGLSARHQGASQQRRRRGGGTHHRPISLTPGVARVMDAENASTSGPPRLIDLSLLPHVSVVDTVEPPALERVSFEPVHAAAKVLPRPRMSQINLPPCWKASMPLPECDSGCRGSTCDQTGLAQGFIRV